MSKYNSFLLLFLISIVAMIAFFIVYIQIIFAVAYDGQDFFRHNSDPGEFLALIFSPQVVITFIIMALSNLAYRIQGIVLVARNKLVSDGEKALWIIGFILMGFITAIVFLILAKNKQFTS